MSATPNMDHSVFLGGPMLIYPKRHADPRHVIVTALLGDVQFCTTPLHQVARRRYTAGTRQSQPRTRVRNCRAPDWQWILKGHARLTFPMGPVAGVRSPPAPELDR